MIKNIGGFYEKSGENIANNYLILVRQCRTAQWDHNAGLISRQAPATPLTLDLYAATMRNKTYPCARRRILPGEGRRNRTP